jgi:hypothetical protein
MSNPDLERALLALAFETDVPLTSAQVAYHLDCSVTAAKQALEALLDQGVLVLDSDDDGNLLFRMPGRPARKAQAPALPQRGRRSAARLHRGAVVANALVPGVGTLLMGRHALGALQLGLAGVAWALIGGYWKDFGDAEHRIWLVLLVVVYVAALVWSLLSVLQHDPQAAVRAPSPVAAAALGDRSADLADPAEVAEPRPTARTADSDRA